MPYDNLTQVSLTQLSAVENWQAQYRLLTQWGKFIVPKPEIRTSHNLVKGCETQTWLVHEQHQQHHRFLFDSDSRIINGLAALLLALVDNKTRAEIAQLDLVDMLRKAGLEKHMTPSRNNGFRMIVQRVYELLNASDEKN